MAEKNIVPTSGIVVSTAISAGGVDAQHCEGIVVSTAIAAGGDQWQHCEGIVVSWGSEGDRG